MAAVALVALLLDQLSKAWIRNNFPEGDGIPLIAGIVNLTHVHNHGAAWGMLSGQRWLLVAVTFVVLLGVGIAAREWAGRGTLAGISLALIGGGAVGNLLDRLRQGYVTDMIDMGTSWNWLRSFPVFNIADSALTVGVILAIWHFLVSAREESTFTSNPEPRT
jgi:signal peptidase II